MSETPDWALVAQKLHQDCRRLERELAEVTRERDELFSHLETATSVARDRHRAAINAEDALEKMIAQRDAIVRDNVDCVAAALAKAAENYRIKKGYTGRSVHKPNFWIVLAAAAIEAVKGGEA